MTIYSTIRIFQGGYPGLVQQGKKTIKKFPSKNTLGIKREIKDTLKGIYGFDVVIVEIGCFYSVFEEDAQFFKKEFSFKVAQPGRQTFEETGFSNNDALLYKYVDKLKNINKTFCVLKQKEISPKKFERTVVISTSEKALGFTF